MSRLLSCIASLAVFLAALPAAVAFADAVTTVVQRDRAFEVSNTQIAAGATIQFMNSDEFDHQIYVNAPDFSFESPEQDPGQLIRLRFPIAGTFQVRCHIHPKMLLRVDVR